MANISSFWGSLSVEGPWTDEDLITLRDMLIELERGYYTLWTDEFDINLLLQGDGVPMGGSGRWSINTNIRNFFNWARIPEENGTVSENATSKTPKEHNQKIDKLMERMHSTGMQIVIEGNDMETGMDFIDQFISKISVVDGEQYTHTDTLDGGSCTLKEYERLYDNDDTYFEEVVAFILLNYKLSDQYTDKIVELLETDSDYYGLHIYAGSSHNLDEFIQLASTDKQDILKSKLEDLYFGSLRDG